MAKSNPVVTPTGIKPNLQILPQNDATFSCFLPDDQSNLRIDSERIVLIKLKSHVACGEIGWLRLKYNTLSSAAEITSLCLAEDSEETPSFQTFFLYVTQLQWAAYTNHPLHHKKEKVRTQKLFIILTLDFWSRLPVPIGQWNPALSACFQFMLWLMCAYVYIYINTHTEGHLYPSWFGIWTQAAALSSGLNVGSIGFWIT